MQFGDFQLDFCSDGTFKLDGGAMFGIVPKALWTRETPADELNRVLLRCNCPLIRTGTETILIDCGLGRKWNEKQRGLYEIKAGPTLLDDLASKGVKPEDITMLIHTHLHLDHAGWNTQVNAQGEFEPVFVNARHFVERKELDVARRPNEMQRATYLAPNLTPLDALGAFELFEERIEIVPGVTVFRTGGHTIGHCCVRIASGEQKALFIGEMMPTTAHRHVPWVMAYDMYPLETLEMKRRLFQECVRDNVLVLLDHDPHAFAVRLREGEGGKLTALKEDGAV